jgi:hypothetical protein
VDWSNPKYIMQIEKSAPRLIKVVLTTKEDKSALPSGETPFQHLPVCINKGSQCLICHSLIPHQVRKSGELQLGEEGRETRIAQCWIFSSVLVYCLGIVLATLY